jgi:hypothetical protein
VTADLYRNLRQGPPHEVTDRGACRGRTDLFELPDRRREDTYSNAQRRQIAEAKAYCRYCPALDPCRRWALTQPDPVPHFIAGGMTTAERDRARKEGW